MDIHSFLQVAPHLPADIAVLVRGETGIGKSHLIHQIGSFLQLPVIDRRLSQMTEGDIIGLPCLKDGTTKFLPVDWIKIASQRPVLLFLDEINRASLEVQQAVFQLVLDRELNGLRLHPETRVYTAINNGMSYQVNNMDPALLRRFWTVDLEPTVKDWLAWAKSSDDMEPVIISFISENSQFLQTSSEERHRNGKIFPTPASWHRFSKCIKHLKCDLNQYKGSNIPDHVYHLCIGFVGMESTLAFCDYIERFELQINVDDILNDWETHRERLSKLRNETVIDIMNKMIRRADIGPSWSLEQSKNATNFIKSYSKEIQVSFFNKVMDCGNVETVMRVHKFIGADIVDIINDSEALFFRQA